MNRKDLGPLLARLLYENSDNHYLAWDAIDDNYRRQFLIQADAALEFLDYNGLLIHQVSSGTKPKP